MDSECTENVRHSCDVVHCVLQRWRLAHAEPVFSVAVNAAHPEMLATGGGDDVAHLWRLGTEAPAFRLEGHTDTVGALAFSMDGSLLATGGLDGTVRVWQANAGTLIGAPLEGPTQGINWVAWHPRGAVLLAGSEDATAWMWKLPEGSVMQIFSAHSSSVACAAQFSRAILRAILSGAQLSRPADQRTPSLLSGTAASPTAASR